MTRPPGASYSKCLSCHPLRDTIDLSKALEQHRAYCSTLLDLGLDVIALPADDDFPDACFVEDCAVVHGTKALITRIGAESRRGEEDAVEAVLAQHLSTRRATPPATVDGGDVVHLQDRLISGLSSRTNSEGIRQMRDWLEVRVDTIEDSSMMHLKSHVTYLGEGVAIATERFAKHPALQGLQVVVVPKGEEYAADTLAIGDSVLMPSGMKEAHHLVERAGFKVIPMDVSEFEKCDGALTCLSIIF